MGATTRSPLQSLCLVRPRGLTTRDQNLAAFVGISAPVDASESARYASA